MRNNVSDIYRYPVFFFRKRLVSRPWLAVVYIPRDSRAQQATSYYFIAGDSADTRLPISPLLLPFATENRNGKRDSCAVSQSSGSRELLIELLETGIPCALPRGAILPRVSRCPSYRYAVVLFKSEPIGESIVRARAFIRSINISNTLAILSRPAHVR